MNAVYVKFVCCNNQHSYRGTHAKSHYNYVFRKNIQIYYKTADSLIFSFNNNIFIHAYSIKYGTYIKTSAYKHIKNALKTSILLVYNFS